MGGLSFTHILLLTIILLVLFGPSRLPQLGSSLGKAIRGFKDAMNEVDGEVRDLPPQQPPMNQVPQQPHQQISQQPTQQSQQVAQQTQETQKKTPVDN